MGNMNFNSLDRGTIPFVNFESVLSFIERTDKVGGPTNSSYVIITTIPENGNVDLLPRIKHTMNSTDEVVIINQCIKESKDISVIIYGLNNTDVSIFKKREQLLSFGFTNIQVYLGGLFEWALLQDIYGEDMFQTTHSVNDILKLK